MHQTGEEKQGLHLPELDIIQLWVGMDVCVGNADELPAVGALRLWRVQSFQNRYQCNIVLQHKRHGRYSCWT